MKGTEIAYLARTNWKTKIDPGTQRCKKAMAEKPCATEPSEDRTVLATVSIADATGELAGAW